MIEVPVKIKWVEWKLMAEAQKYLKGVQLKGLEKKRNHRGWKLC